MRVEQWDNLKHFESTEFEYPDKMNYDFLLKLDRARGIAGVPFILSSTYRDGDSKSHGKGLAVDIKCRNSGNRFKIVSSLIRVGFVRIGIYDRHIHVDYDAYLPLNVMWWGTSK